MNPRNPYPHGADLSIYPTIDAMRSAYLDARYRDYPRCARVALGPWPELALRAAGRSGGDWIDMRPRAHAIVVVPGRVVLLRFARRATLPDIERLAHDRELIAQTPELGAVQTLAIDARLVHCDAVERIADAAHARGIKTVLYSPRLLLRWRDRLGRLPGEGIHALGFDADSLRSYVALHLRQPAAERSDRRERIDGL